MRTEYISLNFLEDIFANPIISRGTWPARSPDLTLPDYFLWDALKRKVYKNNPHTIDELKAAITTHIQQISPDTLQKVFDNMKKRVQTCLDARGTLSTSAVGKLKNVSLHNNFWDTRYLLFIIQTYTEKQVPQL